MTTLHRVTTEYIEAEDRLRLSGEDASGGTVVAWLTQRLMNRLIPHLCQWLEKQAAPTPPAGPTPLAGLKQEFAQQKARAELEPQPPVKARPEGRSVLVHGVQLKSSQSRVTLLFKDAADEVTAVLQLQAPPLRQWLNILYDHYLRAGWATAVWPQWMAEARAAQASGPASVLH